MARLNTVRPIVLRLNSTPVEDLPRHAGFLANSIANSKDVLRASTEDGGKSEMSAHVHKLTTRITSLLQDKTTEGRFTGIVLVNALVEACGPPILSKLGTTWVRLLVSCINNKSDPAQVKHLAVLATARIFILTKGDQALVREITTSALPGFLTACLAVMKPVAVLNHKDGSDKQVQSLLLQPVLESWNQLMKEFSPTFRPFLPSIRAICLSLLSQSMTPEAVRVVAAQVFSSLHFCVIKDGAVSEWQQSVRSIIEAAHQTADVVFGSVLEEWAGVSSREHSTPRRRGEAGEVRSNANDVLGMDKWLGLRAGCLRLVSLLNLLSEMLNNRHAQSVRIPIAEVVDLLGRLAAVLPPTKSFTMRKNTEVNEDEREELFANVVEIHHFQLRLCERLIRTFGRVLLPISQTLVSQCLDILDAEASHVQIRVAAYDFLASALESEATAFSARDSEKVADLVRICCKDINPQYMDRQAMKRQNMVQDGNTTLKTQQTVESMSKRDSPKSQIELAAWELLPLLLSHVPTRMFSSNARAEIDRTAILVAHQEALLSSVMHPATIRKDGARPPSVLPFLARGNTRGLAVEALLRPRMPVIQSIEQIQPVDDTHNEDMDLESEVMLGHEVQMGDSGSPSHHESTGTTLNHATAGEAPLSVERKRDLSSMDETIAASTSEAVKRPRINAEAGDSFGFEAQSDANHPDHDIDHLVTVNTNSNLSVLYADDLQDNAPSQPELTNFEPIDQPVSDISTSAIQLDDDSDDSENVHIDIALTSDEGEDEEDQ